jgi:hypothetical protein
MGLRRLGRMLGDRPRKGDSIAAVAKITSGKGRGMEDKRSCVWMQGPRETTLQVSAAKWWLAITRDVMANEYRRMAAKHRPPVTCDMTPKFVSPLEHQKHG